MVNGIFYPNGRETLIAQLSSWGLRDGFIRNVTGRLPGKEDGSSAGVQAILAPHCAWELAGKITGLAFAAVQEREENGGKPVSRVLLFGTHHNFAEEGIYLSESAFFDTPLGGLVVDQELNQQLASCSSLIKVYDIPHLSEHALEVLLPLVKYCFPAATIVPILMAGTKPALISGLASALKTVLGNDAGENLFVISSNVSINSDPALALSMADEFRSLIEKMDTQAFLEGLAGGCISACGGAIIGALLESELLNGKHFSSLSPMVQATGENGETVYCGAFDCAPGRYV